MKNRPVFLIVALGAALLSLPSLRAVESSAGGPPDGRRGPRHEKMDKRMSEHLGLNEEQKAKIKELNQAERAEMQALRQEENAKAKGVHQSYREKRQALMTPEQREKTDQMRAKMHDRMEKRREHREMHREMGRGKPADPK